MSAPKKTAIITALFIIIFPIAACHIASVQPQATVMASSPIKSSSPIPTVQTSTSTPSITLMTTTPVITTTAPSPTATETPDSSDDNDSDHIEYDIPDLERVGITQEQYRKIDVMLFAALEMDDKEQYLDGKPGYFTQASSLTKTELLAFSYVIINFYSDAIGMNRLGNGTLDSTIVTNIIHSAFSINYVPKEGDKYGNPVDGYYLSYGNGDFTISDSDGMDCPPGAECYSITAITPTRFLLKFNIVLGTDAGFFYVNKGQAVVERDNDSLFGFHFISLTKAKESNIKFTSATASSTLPKIGSRTFNSKNAIDGKDKTAWATSKGTGEWIKLSFNKPQYVTGLVLNFGDWFDENAYDQHGQPYYVSLGFSDGTSIVVGSSCQSDGIGYGQCVTFGRDIKTTYVEITIIPDPYADPTNQADPETQQNGFYITDVIPL